MRGCGHFLYSVLDGKVFTVHNIVLAGMSLTLFCSSVSVLIEKLVRSPGR